MEYSRISNVLSAASVGKLVSIRGWVYRSRSSGGMHFVLVRDATGIVQCAVKKENLAAEGFEAAGKALLESAVELTGEVKEDKRAPGGYEVIAKSFTVTSFADPFPITEHQSTELLLDYRHLWLRSQKLTTVNKVKATILEAMREYCKQEGYLEVTPPIIVSGACEGGSTLFEFDFFGKKSFLSQSAQLYLEALIFSHEKVYAITPSFRAEKSRTVRHLAEYWHMEAEAAYASLDDMLKFEEGLISFLCHKAAKERAAELKFLERNPEDLLAITAPFERLTYDEALAELRKKGRELPWGEDFGTEDEALLTKDRTAPIFVTRYPKSIKAFYMKENPENPRTVLNNDCLAPEGYGEIIGGSQREDSLDKLVKRLKEEGSNPKDYDWYLDLRRFGSVPHSGFGLGTERLVRWICKLDHIRDSIPFPRTINRSYP